MLRCAFYEKEITPPLGCAIPGYFNLRPGSEVKDRLYTRAFVVDNGENRVVIINVDACGLDNSLIKPITDRIEKYTSIAASNILIASTHTHTGIPVADFKSDGTFSEQKGYHELLVKLVADCAVLAYNRLAEGSLEFAKSTVEGISFCRDYQMRNSTPRTNPGRLNPDIIAPCAYTDNELPVLLAKNRKGEPAGAIISFACHPDTVSGTEYSGDYISELEKCMKKVYGQDFVTVFLLGTCGDINHFNVNTAQDAPDHHRMMGRVLAGEALKGLSFAEPVAGEDIVVKKEVMAIPRVAISDEKIERAKHVVATVIEDPNAKIAADNTDPDQYERAMSETLLRFLDTSPEIYHLPLQYIRIGDFEIFAFPGEIFCHFGMLVKRCAKNPKCMVSSLCNAKCGYVPTRDMYYDTIYESLPGSNCLDSEAGYLMSEKLLDMKK